MIICISSIITFKETIIVNNTQSDAAKGGILKDSNSDVFFHNCNFTHNYGQNYLLWIDSSNTPMINTMIVQNTAVKGDFMVITDGINTKFQTLSVRENRGNIKLIGSEVVFSDRFMVYFKNNGSIIAINSFVYFYSNISLFIECMQFLVDELGGINIVTSDQSTLHFYGTTYFVNNYSLKPGGALFARNGKVYIYHEIIVAKNSAQFTGGGICLYQSELYCYYNCTFSQNYAVVMGGGLHAISSKLINPHRKA